MITQQTTTILARITRIQNDIESIDTRIERKVKYFQILQIESSNKILSGEINSLAKLHNSQISQDRLVEGSPENGRALARLTGNYIFSDFDSCLLLNRMRAISFQLFCMRTIKARTAISLSNASGSDDTLAFW